MKKKLTDEERFGVVFTSIVNTVIIIITLLLYSSGPPEERSALIEITLGEFRDGTMTQFSPIRNQEVATRRNPSNVPTPQPEEIQNPVERPVQQQVEPVKEVELPKQEEIIREETINTPVTEKIDPTKTTEEVSPEVVRVQQQAVRAEVERQGAESSGDVRGVRGRVDADQGIGIDPVRSAPYQLDWQGSVQRSPLVQPLPNYAVEAEAVITIRFEVRPNGTVGSMQPIRRTNPELEAEVIRTLRTWRFSSLPANAPQESQFGVITFRFVLN
jgi:TonB family protein